MLVLLDAGGPRGAVNVAIAVAVLVNLVTWGAFRIDKRRAERGGRRFRESMLLGGAALGGGTGALIAMYGHRRRHKVAKPGFAAVVWLLALGQLALVGWLVVAGQGIAVPICSSFE